MLSKYLLNELMSSHTISVTQNKSEDNLKNKCISKISNIQFQFEVQEKKKKGQLLISDPSRLFAICSGRHGKIYLNSEKSQQIYEDSMSY